MNIRIAEEKDIPEIVDLLTTAFPRFNRSRKHWEWSHFNGHGLPVVALHDGHIVGHYSFGYRVFELDERVFTAGFGQQAAVHPAHRDLQTIVDLIRFAEQAASANCDFVYAFPNGNMAPIKDRVLGWTKVLTFPTWTLPIADFNRKVREMADKTSADRFSVRRLATFSGLDLTGCTLTDFESIAPVKNVQWFEWRYIMHPQSHYACFGAFSAGQCEGVMVLKTYSGDEGRLGHIIELHSRDGIEPESRLLSVAADYFDYMGVDCLSVWNEYKPDRALYKRLDFTASNVTSSLYAKALKEDAKSAIAADWSFDMGVTDVF